MKKSEESRFFFKSVTAIRNKPFLEVIFFCPVNFGPPRKSVWDITTKNINVCCIIIVSAIMWVFLYFFLSLSEEHWRVCSSRHIEPLCFQENGIFLNNVRTHTNLAPDWRLPFVGGVSPVRILVYFFLVGWSKVYLCVSLQVFVCFFPTAEGSSYMNIHIWPHRRPGCGGTLQSQGLMSTCSLVWTRSRVKFSFGGKLQTQPLDNML